MVKGLWPSLLAFTKDLSRTELSTGKESTSLSQALHMKVITATTVGKGGVDC